ncbi:MAG: lysozyme [Oculatellaceae cyanobacterium Prado106]|jgi:GH24 family phage-related lysozyme (muramidase)|nr:lysozyme [Oculatellaceae cyanobacterium Prado106]
MSFSLKILLDTWLKLSTEQGSKLPDDQKQFIDAGTLLPIASFEAIGGDHIRVAFGVDRQGRQIAFKGRNTWFVYRPSVQVLQNGQVIIVPKPAPVISLSARVIVDTWLKQSTVQSAALASEHKQFIDAGTVLSVSSYNPAPADHLRIAFGRNSQGQQIAFKGRNTWFVYRPAIQLLQNGQIIITGDSSPASIGKINAKGLELIKSFEGLRLEAYLDAVGIWTIGFGTTEGVAPGMRITLAQAEAFLKRDVEKFETAVIANVTAPINVDQFSALVSFVYNVGAGAFAGSTLLQMLNRRDYQGAADQLLRWNKGGSEELPGLTRRRQAERALFLGQDYKVFL